MPCGSCTHPASTCHGWRRYEAAFERFKKAHDFYNHTEQVADTAATQLDIGYPPPSPSPLPPCPPVASPTRRRDAARTAFPCCPPLAFSLPLSPSLSLSLALSVSFGGFVLFGEQWLCLARSRRWFVLSRVTKPRGDSFWASTENCHATPRRDPHPPIAVLCPGRSAGSARCGATGTGYRRTLPRRACGSAAPPTKGIYTCKGGKKKGVWATTLISSAQLCVPRPARGAGEQTKTNWSPLTRY